MSPALQHGADERHAAACEAARRVLAEFESPEDELGGLRRRYRRLQERADR